ncbi:DUF3658 domain-containing protein [Bacillus sp. FJAT-45037]|uniref:DUF3658 domain-containing protein n=1 Tax=Bacillus sp. FJAT-45037 TaxID=2011007 RepID=UPI000C24CC8A|nr:DUF3658 domain-containing protein [Bacillus sp. FJAT-45037]
MIQLIFSRAATEAFDLAIQEDKGIMKGKLKVYEPYLQLGDMRDEQKRLGQLSQIFGFRTDSDEIANLQEQFYEERTTIQKFLQKGEEVMCWVGEEAADELAFLSLISSISTEDLGDNLKLNRVRGPLLVRELLPENLELHMNPVEVTVDMLNQLQASWNVLLDQGSDIRVRKADFIYDYVSFNHYDDLLLTFTKRSEPVNIKSIIGQMYGRHPHLPFPFFLWRIHTLAKKGVLHVVNDTMNEMEGTVILK